MKEAEKKAQQKRLRIALTYEQARALRPYFERVKAAVDAGQPGMVLAQLIHDRETGHYWMEPAWLDPEVARRIEQQGQEIA
jgi:hypothetical protein